MRHQNGYDLSSDIVEFLSRHPAKPFTHDDITFALGVKKDEAYSRSVRRARWKALANDDIITPCAWDEDSQAQVLYFLTPETEGGLAYAGIRREYRDMATRIRNTLADVEWGVKHAGSAEERAIYRMQLLTITFQAELNENLDTSMKELEEERRARRREQSSSEV